MAAKVIRFALAQPTADPRASAVLDTIIERIEATLDAEMAAFKARKPIDLAATNQRKRQALLEISRLMTGGSAEMFDAEARARLVRLSSKLESNRRMLEIQLRAVKEVADIIAATLREAESDGTYSMPAGWS